MMSRVFFAQDIVNGGVVKIIEGTMGYSPTDLDLEQMEQQNALNGVTVAESLAAVSCSMFDCWANFDKLVKEVI